MKHDLGFASPQVEFLLPVVVAPLILFAILWFPLTVFGLGAEADFIQFYAAGRLVIQGAAPQLYELAQHSEVLRQFTHPPFEAILYAALAHFAYATAFRIWLFVNLSLLGLVFALLRAYGAAFGLAERLLLLSCAFFPVLAALAQGQDSLLVVLSFTTAFLALKQDRDVLAGLCLGVALIRPQLVLPFVVLTIMYRGWRILSGLAVAGVVLVAVSALVFGVSPLMHYPQMLLHMNESGNAINYHLLPGGMINIRGITYLLFHKSVAPAAVNVATAVLSLGLFAWAMRKREIHGSFDLWFAKSVLVAMLVSFHLLLHDLSLIILPAFLFLNYLAVHEPQWSTVKFLLVSPLPAIFVIIFAVQAIGLRDFGIAVVAVIGLAIAIENIPLQISVQPA